METSTDSKPKQMIENISVISLGAGQVDVALRIVGGLVKYK
jgi:hypothetical protein